MEETRCPACSYPSPSMLPLGKKRKRTTYIAGMPCPYCSYKEDMPVELSVQPVWMRRLPLQQQSIMLLAARGPDGVPKSHPCKTIHAAYRATIFLQARRGRELHVGEASDSFASMHTLASPMTWEAAMSLFFGCVDALPVHYITHLMHGAQVLGYKHPDLHIRAYWAKFYNQCVQYFHLEPETEEDMDKRLSDWNREGWDE